MVEEVRGGGRRECNPGRICFYYFHRALPSASTKYYLLVPTFPSVSICLVTRLRNWTCF